MWRTGRAGTGYLTPGAQLTVRRHFATLAPPCTITNSPKAVEIKKAIITAAGQSQRTLPLQTLVDRDGAT
jgi:hypothetical protein